MPHIWGCWKSWAAYCCTQHGPIVDLLLEVAYCWATEVTQRRGNASLPYCRSLRCTEIALIDLYACLGHPCKDEELRMTPDLRLQPWLSIVLESRRAILNLVPGIYYAPCLPFMRALRAFLKCNGNARAGQGEAQPRDTKLGHHNLIYCKVQQLPFVLTGKFLQLRSTCSCSQPPTKPQLLKVRLL